MTDSAAAPLPLTLAARRRRGKPGRPRIPAMAAQASALPAAPPLTRANAPSVAVVWLRHVIVEKDDDGKTVEDSVGKPVKRVDYLPYSARLVSLTAAAAYVGVSTWVVREWLANGLLKRVRLPADKKRDVGRLLFDVADLDALIEAGKP